MKLTFPAAPDRASWLLSMRRLTSRSLAGTTRKLVAVGTVRLDVMLATTRAGLPRRGTTVPSTAPAGAGVGAAGPAPVVASPPGPVPGGGAAFARGTLPGRAGGACGAPGRLPAAAPLVV